MEKKLQTLRMGAVVLLKVVNDLNHRLKRWVLLVGLDTNGKVRLCELKIWHYQ